MNILFIGDIVGKIGRRAVAKILPRLKKEEKIDLVIANAENTAHGSGITEKIVKELQSFGVDWMTMGDHAFKKVSQIDVYGSYPILRPANYSNRAPGSGYAVVKVGKYRILLVSLIGRIFMDMDFNCPFERLEELLLHYGLPGGGVSAIIVEIHAEASSEKIALKHFVDGRVSAVLGTHTHVMTADSGVTGKGTAYITDVGMVGAADGCIGVDRENIIKTFLTQIKYPYVIPEKGRAVFNAARLTISPGTGRARAIKPIVKFIDIKT